MAYAGGIVPYERTYPTGTVRVGPARVRGSLRYRPQAGVSSAVGTPSANGTPPPGYYNPQHEWEVEAGQERLGNLEGTDNLNLARAGTDYATQLGQIERREGDRRQSSERTKAALARAFTNLASRQGEQANRAGVLQGGALIQAAAKRTANEGRQQGEQQDALARGLLSDKEAREALALDLAPPVSGSDWSSIAGGTTGAGRRIVDMARGLIAGQGEQSTFEKNARIGEGNEAAELGYEPEAPARAAAPAQRFLNRRTGRMETRAAMHRHRRR